MIGKQPTGRIRVSLLPIILFSLIVICIGLVFSFQKTTRNSNYEKLQIDEMGWVPIMMYHEIFDRKNSETQFTGGNVDADGYNRTSEALRADLEFYYSNDYRFVRLQDYINGSIDVEAGKSPIILTFDDGNIGNCRVTGRDTNGKIIIDPNCAVGIMEDFKKTHPDAHITATFFLNGSLFRQAEYNIEIMQWLVNNGYDIGNHTKSHINFDDAAPREAIAEVGYMYKKFDEIIPGQYVKILSLPYGIPTDPDADIRDYIDTITYEGVNYVTEGVLAVGWTCEYSCFDVDLDTRMIKRCRAYNNNGEAFDIDQVFQNILPGHRFVSDGDPNTIVIPRKQKKWLNNPYGKKVTIY